MASKKLTISAIKKDNSKFNEKMTVPIKDGKYEIIVNKYFKKTDASKLLGDYITITEQLIERERCHLKLYQRLLRFQLIAR